MIIRQHISLLSSLLFLNGSFKTVIATAAGGAGIDTKMDMNILSQIEQRSPNVELDIMEKRDPILSIRELGRELDDNALYTRQEREDAGSDEESIDEKREDDESRLEIRQDDGVAVAGVDYNIANLQTFTGDIGGVKASPIVNSGAADRPYAVEGDTFPDFTSAYSRSCDNQADACNDAANNGHDASVSLVACSTQLVACKAAGATATKTNFQVLRMQDEENLVFCDS